MATAYLHRNGVLTLRHDVRTDWPEFLVPVPPAPQPIIAIDDDAIPLTKCRIDVYERHGLRGKFPVYRYVRTDEI